LQPVLAAFLVALLLFSSGCALFWLGAGGAGGYLIRKGEEGGDAKRKDSAESSGAKATEY
ncbi:MAG: hypothetical protein ACREP8_12500, partial [Candidatus Binatia bacterium]